MPARDKTGSAFCVKTSTLGRAYTGQMDITRISLSDPTDRSSLQQLINQFATSEAGGGEAIAPGLLHDLPDQLAACPTYIGLLARVNGESVGLLNSFWSVSTFKARPLINIHDVTINPAFQSRGIGAKMFAKLESIGREMNCCKLTLEVLDGNRRASALYERLGFEFYQLDPAHGQARFMQKLLLQAD